MEHHEQELKKEFEVIPNSNDQGYSLKMKTKSISQFALWNHDILYIDKSEFTSEICIVKESKQERGYFFVSFGSRKSCNRTAKYTCKVWID